MKTFILTIYTFNEAANLCVGSMKNALDDSTWRFTNMKEMYNLMGTLVRADEQV